MASLPGGTVTFLFTDIEGSTSLWEKHPGLMAESLQVHNDILCRAIEGNGGVVFRFVGDAIYAAFPTAPQALSAAVHGQRELACAEWNELDALRVRMGIHTGEAIPNEAGDYDSHTMNRVARVMSAGHGGQILLSDVSAKLCERNLPEGIDLLDQGRHRLKGLTWLEHLYQVCGSGLVKEFPPLNTLDLYPHNLPLQLTSFLGREKEITRVRDLINDNRLVTLTGPGGVGKTRLSLEVAFQALEDFPDGAWFVELAVIREPEALPLAVAKAIGLQDKKNVITPDILLNYLNGKKALIILDNCEHLVESCAAFAEMLLTRISGVSILVTSRESFQMQGEAVYIVPSLNFPRPGQLLVFENIKSYEAVRLFEERARTVHNDFQLSQQNAGSVARICQHLDGIPLAIELAAARANTLTIDQIADRLADVFGLLNSGRRTSLPRHKTLLAAIRWSYDLLNHKERSLLCRLSVFIGGWSLNAAEEVCSGNGLSRGDVFDLLCSLINKSMVVVQQSQAEELRYSLLETIRRYAEEELLEVGQSDWAARQHFEYFLVEAEENNNLLQGSTALKAFMWFVREQPNLQAARKWAESGVPPHDLPGAERLAAITHRDWHGHGTHRLTRFDR